MTADDPQSGRPPPNVDQPGGSEDDQLEREAWAELRRATGYADPSEEPDDDDRPS